MGKTASTREYLADIAQASIRESGGGSGSSDYTINLENLDYIALGIGPNMFEVTSQTLYFDREDQEIHFQNDGDTIATLSLHFNNGLVIGIAPITLLLTFKSDNDDTVYTCMLDVQEDVLTFGALWQKAPDSGIIKSIQNVPIIRDYENQANGK